MSEREKQLLMALETVNRDYLNIKNSDEYQLGMRVRELKETFKRSYVQGIRKILKKIISKTNVSKPGIAKNTSENQSDADWRNDFGFLLSDVKVAVYSCVLGGYDTVADPLLVSDDMDFFLFTEEAIQSKVWKKKEIPEYLRKLGNNTLINRYIKMHPAELFPGYDYAVYIDGNVTVVSDLRILLHKTNCKTGIAMHTHVLRNCIYEEGEACIAYGKGNADKLKTQLEHYKEKLFPNNYGLLEATIIISDLSNKESANILNAWWEEFYRSESLRDQIALPFILWSRGLKINDVGILGANVYQNPKFRVKSH